MVAACAYLHTNHLPHTWIGNVLDREEWQAAAKCRGADTDTYHWDNLGDDKERRAYELCNGCPVITQCANYARANQVTDYVYAGHPFKPADYTPPKTTFGAGRTISTHCAKGHELTTNNIHWSTVRGVRTRRCLTCRKDALDRQNERKKARREAHRLNDARLRKAAS